MTPARARKLRQAWLLLGMLLGIGGIYLLATSVESWIVLPLLLVVFVHTFLGNRWIEPWLDKIIAGRMDNANGQP